MTEDQKAVKRERSRLWVLANPERHRENQRRHYAKNREKMIARSCAWRVNNLPVARERERGTMKRRRKDPVTGLQIRVTCAVNKVLKSDGRKNSNTFKRLGYTPQQLKAHLQSLFLPGMSWSNTSEWHIDHKKPKCSFVFDSMDHPEFRKCWALDNLQPLWATDNVKKGAKYEGINYSSRVRRSAVRLQHGESGPQHQTHAAPG